MTFEDPMLRVALQMRFSLFEAFYSISSFQYSEAIPTACVTFDSEGECLSMLVNPTFWNTRSLIQKEFILCHETLHVFYMHGVRGKDLDKEISNIAMDLVINEELVRRHGFNRSIVDPENNLVWHDKYFSGDFLFKSFEYYYNRLIDSEKNKKIKPSGFNHDYLQGIPEEISEDILKGARQIEKNQDADSTVNIADSLNTEEVCKIAGVLGGSGVFTVNVKKVSPKVKFLKYIKNTSVKHYKEKLEYNWKTEPRRMYSVRSSFFMPNETPIEKFKRDKCKAVVFMDTSGSCVSYKEYFWKIASAIPADKYEIDLYCFDTRVFQTTFASKKLYGFGGTSFRILSNKINEYKKHPDLVFVITDGYGDCLNIEQPEKWVWLMTEHNTKMYIPSGCTIDNLSDFDL